MRKDFAATVVLLSLLSLYPADPTLTTENAMEVVKGVERRWWDLATNLEVRYQKAENIQSLVHSDIQGMEAVLKEYVNYHPLRTWGNVAEALQLMGLHQQADDVTNKYVRGTLCI